MKFNRIASSVIAAGLLLGSAGLAVAGNPFALYQEAHDPVNAGTSVTTMQTAAVADMTPAVVAGPASAAMGRMLVGSATLGDNPFALYQEDHDPANTGTAVAASHLATSADVAIGQIASDPFN